MFSPETRRLGFHGGDLASRWRLTAATSALDAARRVAASSAHSTARAAAREIGSAREARAVSSCDRVEFGLELGLGLENPNLTLTLT